MKSLKREIIGLVPAGGSASRIAPLPCSKELFPVGFRVTEPGVRPKVVSHYLLEAMRTANIRKAFIILRNGKWDIPGYYGDGKMLNMDIAYLMMNLPYGVPYTLDQAYPFVRDSIVALGFPDMIIQPHNVFIKLLAKLEQSGADIVLGLFPAFKPEKTDMVELDANGHVCGIHIKPDQTDLAYAWEIAVWTPVFTSFMHDYLAGQQKTRNGINDNMQIKESIELHVGDVIQAAIQYNMKLESVLFKDGSCLDIGTPEDLIRALHRNALMEEELRN